ncbi:MAG: hypothetical protein RR319_01230 [Bacteroides sp.]
MRIYKPSVTTIRVIVSLKERVGKFTVLEARIAEVYNLFLPLFDSLTERPAGQRISDAVKVSIFELTRTTKIAGRTINVYNSSFDFVVERLIDSVNRAERLEMIERANNIMKGRI